MVRSLAGLLLCFLMLPLVGCGGGDKAANETATPAPAAAPTAAATPAAPTPSAVATPAPVAPAAVADVSPFVHHAPGDVLLAMARPGRVLVNPIVTGIIKEMDAADATDKVEDRLKSIQEELGLDPKQVEYVVVSISAETVSAMAPPPGRDQFGPPGAEFPPPSDPKTEEAQPAPENDEIEADEENADAPPSEPPTTEFSVPDGPGDGGPPADFGSFEPPPSPAVLVRLNAPFDGEAFINQITAREKANTEKIIAVSPKEESLPKEMQEIAKKHNEEFRAKMAKKAEFTRSEHAGLVIYQKGESKDRICFLNSQTLLYAPEATVKAAIDRKGVAESTPLATQLQSVQDRDVAIGIDISPLNKLMQSGSLDLPFPVQLFAAPILKCKYLSLAADVQGGHLLQVNLIAADEAGAKQLHAMLNPMLQDAIKKGKAAKNDPNMSPTAAAFVPLGEQLLDGTSLTQTGDALSLVIARPASLGDLPTLVRPLIADAVQQKRVAMALNDLKQIGLAMHNYHDVFGSFPANDRGETEAVGLSWRVHLLPYLYDFALYQEFHMDEPWDSDHNKALIPRMPKIFGNSPEGKTSIHVFVGESTPFGGKPIGITGVVDGTSNTIMVVRAGDDTAEIWTKPGGLAFDKANPIQALGNIGEKFDVLFMDASVRSLPKSIDPATLGNLIQHSDGNTVEIPE